MITKEIITYYPSYSVTRETAKVNLNSIGINIGPIFQYKIMENLLLYTSIGNLHYSYTRSNNITNSNGIGFWLSTGLSLGFNIIF